jgi:hypothetical protein
LKINTILYLLGSIRPEGVELGAGFGICINAAHPLTEKAVSPEPPDLKFELN